jgi:uncharacterized protein
MSFINRPGASRSFAALALVTVLSGTLPAAYAQTAPAPAAPAAPAPASPPPAAAPLPASHLAAAVDVLKASGLMVMIENATPNVVDGIRANMSRQRPELVKEIEESLAVTQAAIAGIRTDGLTNAASVLAERMTEAELKEIGIFLNSPAGKKYVSILPQYVEDIVPLLEGWSVAASERLTRIFQEEMAKRGHKI